MLHIPPYVVSEAGFAVSTDRSLLDMDVIHGFLSKCYWSPNIPRATLERGIANSLCFGVYEEGRAQVGFCRVISDRATFAYLCDVFVLESHRGRGLSKLLMRAVLGHPELQGLRNFCLFTRDAHKLYAQFGFAPMPDPARYMGISRRAAEVYGPG